MVFAGEPTGNLDSKTKGRGHDDDLCIRHDFNQTIVLVAHDPQMASYADRIVTLLDGRITSDRLNTDLSPPNCSVHAVRLKGNRELTDGAPLPPHHRHHRRVALHAVTGTCRHLPSAPGVRSRRLQTAQAARTVRLRGSDGDSAPIAGPVPNIIVTNFTYGGDSVAAGMISTSTSPSRTWVQVAVTNMVITVDGGELRHRGRHEHVLRRRAVGGYAMTQSVPMQALSSPRKRLPARDRELPIQEYVDASARSSSQSDVKISVPISQPDRFEISDPVVPDQVIAGQENTVTMG